MSTGGLKNVGTQFYISFGFQTLQILLSGFKNVYANKKMYSFLLLSFLSYGQKPSLQYVDEKQLEDLILENYIVTGK